jgi:hypothetical protein
MNVRFFTPLLSLVSIISIISVLTACGSGGSSSSTAVPAATLTKNAIVTVGVDSNNFSGKANKISSSTNYIQLYVTQWQAGDLNSLTITNQATDTLTVSNPTATLTLYPTYTRICATQYSGTPSSSSTPTEASCSFGMLNSGNNTVTLTMLAGTWTFSSIYNGVKSAALSYPNITTATTGSASYGVYDGSLENYKASKNNAPAQSINNWGSDYQLQLKDSSGNIVTGLDTSFAWATSFFNSGDSGPSFVAYVKAQSAPGTKTEASIGGFGKGVDSDGWIRETKNIIWYPLKSNSPVIVYPTSALKVEDKSGANVTSTIFANCQLQVLSGSSTQACGITNIENNGTSSGSSDIQKGTSNNYNYKVTSTAAAAGADICYVNNASAARDSGGNVICYDYDYFTSASGTSCPSNGTYRNGRCEYTLNKTCTNDIHSGGPNSSNIYDTTAQSCTVTSVGYFLKLNSTALTLTAN